MFLEDEIIDYKKNEESIVHWTTLKGDFRYKKIIEFLKNKNIPLTWDNITNYIRYDKRLLINSFKYIIFLEEFFKSIVCNSKKYSYNKACSFDFRKAVNDYLSMNNIISFDDNNIDILREYKDFIISFRNAVAHNKILLIERYGKGNDKIDLESVLKLYIQILPKSYRDGFIKDINKCAIGLVENSWHINL